MKRVIFILIVLSSLSACRSTSSSALSKNPSKYESVSESDNLFSKDFEKNMDFKRVVIYDATLDLVVKNPDSCNQFLTILASKYEGYVQTLGNRVSVIRVRASKLNDAVSEISDYGKLKYKLISGRDVTDQYRDYDVRLNNALKARERYLELLSKAENVESALKVEKELERLNIEIDSLKGKISQLNNLSDYATITVNIQEKIKPGILGYIGIGIYRSVKWLFVRN